MCPYSRIPRQGEDSDLDTGMRNTLVAPGLLLLSQIVSVGRGHFRQRVAMRSEQCQKVWSHVTSGEDTYSAVELETSGIMLT